MKYRVELGLVFFLLLFFISIGDPLVYVGGMIRRFPKLEMSADMRCLNQAVPSGARALFFSNPDGTLDWNAFNYIATRTQYDLAPRVVAVVTTGRPPALETYPYLLAFRMDTQTLAQVAGFDRRQVLQTCGSTTVLGPSH